MGGFSFWHILLLAVILLLVFGGNRFSNMMGDVAKGLKSFKQGMADDEEEERRKEMERRRLMHDRPIDVTPEPRRTETVTPPPPPPPPPPADDHNR
jgi:sec-independent protein translocase protein TatA